MLRLTLTNLWARKRRLVGSSIAIILGVAFFFATLVVTDTTEAGFDTAFTDANRNTDVIVRDATTVGSGDVVQRGLVDPAVADEVGAVDGVASVAIEVAGTAQIVGSDGDLVGGDGPPTTAGNWIDDPALNAWTLTEGRAPSAPGEVVIDRRSAGVGDLSVGDTTTVRTPAVVEVTVVGIATMDDADSIGGITYVAFDTPTAQDVLLGEPAASALLVAAEPGVDAEQLRDRLASALPGGLEALTGAELTEEQLDDLQSDFLGFMRVFLLAFAGVALLVATFSINNTLSILVAQRSRESALLRAVGGTRRQVLAATAGEALALGLVASALGLVVGLGLAAGLLAVIGDIVSDLPGGTLVTGGSIAAALVAGTVVTAIATIAPAVRASRVAPLAALREVAIDRTGRSLVRLALGVVLTGGGAAMTVLADRQSDGALARAGLGALLAVTGVFVLAPVVARPVLRIIGAPLRRFRGETGRLAVGNAVRNPRRTAASASALLVGSAVVTLFTVIGASVSASIGDSVDRSFGGDLVIVQDSFSGAAIDPELAPALEATPEVETAAALQLAPVRLDGEDVVASAIDPSRFTAVLDVDESEGRVADLRPGELAMSDLELEQRDWAVGDEIPVEFADGTTDTFTVTSSYSAGDIAGGILLHVDDWAPRSQAAGDIVVLIGLADGVSMSSGQAVVDSLAERYGAPDPQTRDEYVASIDEQVDQLLALVYGLLALAVLIALMGIANTLSLAIHERTRELGLLRAVGQTRAQLRATVRWESVLTALFGTVAGIGVGVFLGWGLVRAVAAEEGFGTFTAPVGPLVVILVVAAIAGTLAGWRPARRAARLDIVRALAAD